MALTLTEGDWLNASRATSQQQARAASRNGQAVPPSAAVRPAKSPRMAEVSQAPLSLTKPPFPEPPGRAALMGLAGTIIDAVMPHTEADASAVLVQLLAAFGCAAKGPYMMVGATRHEARIFPAIVGTSSKGRKGDSVQPVRVLLERADPDFAVGHIQGGLSSGEGMLWAVRDAVIRNERVKGGKDEPARYEETIVDEGVSDKRLLIIEPEFARVFDAQARQGNTLSALIRDCWDRGNLQSMTKGAPLRATGAHIAIIGHITYDELRAKLSSVDAANGFANRFVFVCARRSKELPEPEPFEGEIVWDLGDELAERLNWARGIERMERDEPARKLWREIYHELSAEKEGLVGSLTARSEAQVLRLSMLYALLDATAVIRTDHLEAAHELWRFSERCVEYIFGNALGDRVADAIYRALCQRGEMSRTEINKLFAGNEPASRIQVALALLHEKGKAIPMEKDVDGRGRPVEIWQVTGN